MPRRRELKPCGIPVATKYSAIVAPYNLDYRVVPAAVAFPHTDIQVVALVECAVVSGYKVQAKSGGHSANYGSFTGELSTDFQNLQHSPWTNRRSALQLDPD
ncbi:hypothetical protein V1506DRAFT_509961 [Lipomyces tetrasporus]